MKKRIFSSTSQFRNRFLLVRHGESIWNIDSKFTGWTNIPLTENGRTEASNIASTLIRNNIYPNIIFTSVLDRSIETTNIIKKQLNLPADIPIHTSWRLNEKHYGTLEGVPRRFIRDKYGEEFTRMMRSDFYMKPPFLKDPIYDTKYPVYRNCYFETIKYGESKENVLQRLLPYFENDILYTLSEKKLPLIITHKHTARVLMKHLLKLNDQEFQLYELPSKKIFLFTLNDKLEYESHLELKY